MTSNILIGEHYADVLNGLSFIHDQQAAFLVRIGWVHDKAYHNTALWHHADRIDFGPATPDGTYGELGWRAGACNIRHRWLRRGDAVVAEVSVSEPCTVTLECSRAWDSFVSRYRLAESGFTGRGHRAGLPGRDEVDWTLRYDRTPATRNCHSFPEDVGLLVTKELSRDAGAGTSAAAAFDLTPGQPLRYVAGFGDLPAMADIGERLDQAADAYARQRCRAEGDWGDFLAPIANVLNHSKVYNFQTGRVCHTITRCWGRGDGHNLFEWDSFFNALMASIEDPEGARETVRCLLLEQQESGLLPSYSGPRWNVSWDRSQPPVGAMCVWKLHQRWPDQAFLEDIYPKLLKWHDWWFAPRPENGLPHRDGNQNGLLEWGTERDGDLQLARWESGLDDSPMYDMALGNPDTRTMELDDVGLNALWAMDAAFLARIAAALGRTDDATRLRDEADAMRARLETLWNAELGLYCNRYWSDASRADRDMGPIIPESCLATEDGRPGLKQEFFHDCELKEPGPVEIVPCVDYYAGLPLEEKRNPKYSVRWTGTVTPPESAEVTFTIRHLNGARLWIDDELVIDHWLEDKSLIQSAEPHAVSVSPALSLEAGRKYRISAEYGQFCWHQRFQLGWRTGDTPPRPLFSDVISPTCFYPMIVGAPDDRQAGAMLKELKARFWGEYVCPSIDRTHPAFYSEHYWRGKIWGPMNYLLFQGLKQYAPDELLEEFAAKSVRLFMKNWTERGWCSENFWTNGNGASVPHYTWGALLCMVGYEAVRDIDPDGNVVQRALKSDVRLCGPAGGVVGK